MTDAREAEIGVGKIGIDEKFNLDSRYIPAF